ncbi:MAG: hypothetical protein GWN01_16430 [Nitrosopumilaceae archaeon]|nr:hypothetical protein [Nitrosopumilaceae archaeon]NIU88869.1 hypothetical protein [Nitrosopumilaceae archaeon]NIV66989.1 hypothetical protein [Nitrosopumilaceae archaeon]NIX63024.1 hypothetical protein [Nitrosopumilaceae archaeon]
MSEPTWVVTDNDKRIAQFSLINQLQMNNLTHLIHDDDFAKFFDNQVEVIASYMAQCRFLQNIIHKNIGG